LNELTAVSKHLMKNPPKLGNVVIGTGQSNENISSCKPQPFHVLDCSEHVAIGLHC